MRHPVYHSQSALVTAAQFATIAAAASLGIEPKDALPLSFISTDLFFILNQGLPKLVNVLLRFNRMSIRTVPTLQELVIQNVLHNEALPIPNLEYLPRVLTLQLYKEAIMGGHMEMVKKMVLSCPLACLPVDYLLKTRDVKALKTLLNGLDLLISQNIYPRKWKLKAIDFREVNQDSPNEWSRAPLSACSQEATSPKEREKCSQRAARPRLKIFIDFDLDKVFQRFLGSLREWVEERKGVVRIYCEKLQIGGFYLKLSKFLRTLPLYYVQELEVNAQHWTREIMEHFCFVLIEMKNLCILHLSDLSPQVFTGRSINRWFSHRFSLQLRKVNKLHELYVNNVFFLYGALHKILLSRTPLKTLSLRGCPLKEKDLKHLSLCPSTDQLKCLDLSSFSMKDMSPEPLRVLLEKVAHTLETLVLEFCEITESQLNAISPALGHCSQLKTFSFYGNQIPLTALKNLLSHTASLPLEQAKYPAPLESFDKILWGFWTEINPMKFDQVRKELMQLVKDIRPVHDIQIYSYDCVLHLKHTDFIA
ncbi:PRAME family member 12-like [Marmota flaviventris]|uniref:PRAME family member 12-like n=1 Tax=Marmota flaviventris TaxID=93162 RepID=UPI003A869034